MKQPDQNKAKQRFDARQKQALALAFRAGDPLVCPTCDVPLDVTPVPQRTDVSYVRDRVWVACPLCHHTTILDRREGP